MMRGWPFAVRLAVLLAGRGVELADVYEVLNERRRG